MKISKATLPRLRKKVNQLKHDNSTSYKIGHINNAIKTRSKQWDKYDAVQGDPVKPDGIIHFQYCL